MLVTGAEEKEIKVLSALIDKELKEEELLTQKTNAMDAQGTQIETVTNEIQKLTDQQSQGITITQDSIDVLQQEIDTLKQKGEDVTELEAKLKALQNAQKGGISVLNPQTIVTAAQGISQIATAITNLNKILDTLDNKDLSFFEKLTSVIPSLAMYIPMMSSGLSKLGPI